MNVVRKAKDLLGLGESGENTSEAESADAESTDA
jgi:hypothetical protein